MKIQNGMTQRLKIPILVNYFYLFRFFYMFRYDKNLQVSDIKRVQKRKLSDIDAKNLIQC